EPAPPVIYALPLHDALPICLGLGYLLVALVYRLPIAVQPMKAVGAVALTGAVEPEALAASGLILGLLIAAVGLLRAAERLVRLRSEEHTSELQSRENLVCRL